MTRELSPLRTKLKLKAVKTSLRDTHAGPLTPVAAKQPKTRHQAQQQRETQFRVVHFSLQNTHLHLIVEAADKDAPSRGLRALQIRIARRLNRLAHRKGRVFTDRYHARALTTPREARAALAYVLLNGRHHAATSAAFDPCSSADVFDGWTRRCAARPELTIRATATPKTWLLRIGWRKYGEISPDEIPGRP